MSCPAELGPRGRGCTSGGRRTPSALASESPSLPPSLEQVLQNLEELRWSRYLHYCPLCDLWPWNLVLPCQPVQLSLVGKSKL